MSEQVTADTDICFCPKCGRSHRPMGFGKSPLAITGGLSHDDLCRLSRLFNEKANLGWEKDMRINNWLKKQIADSK